MVKNNEKPLKIIQKVCVFHCFRPCERMRKHAFAGQNTQQLIQIRKLFQTYFLNINYTNTGEWNMDTRAACPYGLLPEMCVFISYILESEIRWKTLAQDKR